MSFWTNKQPNKSPYVIAEIGYNHEGQFPLAMELIHQAKEAGANAVKFQTCIPELYIAAADAERRARLESFRLTNEHYRKLAVEAHSIGIDFFSTPLDPESAAFLNQIQKCFKIASGDNNYFDLLEQIAGYKKPILLSTGLLDLDGIRASLDVIKRINSFNDSPKQLAVMHCVTSYPVAPHHANLKAIQTLKAHFGQHTIGYSDHTLGVQACLDAYLLGAEVIEKHFTLRKDFSDFRDHQLSADPVELKMLIERLQETTERMGSGEKAPQECEHEFLAAIRRKAHVKEDLPAGTKLTSKDIVWQRDTKGIAPEQRNLLHNAVLACALSAGDVIEAHHLLKASVA